PIKLGNRLRQFTRSVGAGNDLLGLCTIKVRAPVSHNTITAVRATALPAIADDRVIRNADGHAVNYRQSRACRVQTRDTVGQTLGTSRDLREVRAGERVHHDCGQPGRESNQANSNFSDSIAGQIAPAMRSTNKDNTLYPGIRAK